MLKRKTSSNRPLKRGLAPSHFWRRCEVPVPFFNTQPRKPSRGRDNQSAASTAQRAGSLIEGGLNYGPNPHGRYDVGVQVLDQLVRLNFRLELRDDAQRFGVAAVAFV